jgi:hypothetical protein
MRVLVTGATDAGEAIDHFGWLGFANANDLPASSAVTLASLGWVPTGPGLIAGLQGDYLA